MVAGATAMERILTEDALKNLNALGDWMKEEINKMFTSDESPFLMTGLGSINQFHCTLSSNQNQVLDLLFFNLLERGFWITERGLVSLSFAMTEEDVQRFIVASIFLHIIHDQWSNDASIVTKTNERNVSSKPSNPLCAHLITICIQ